MWLWTWNIELDIFQLQLFHNMEFHSDNLVEQLNQIVMQRFIWPITELLPDDSLVFRL